MKITIEGKPKELKKLLNAIGSSKEQSKAVVPADKIKDFKPLLEEDGSLFLRKVTKIKETYPQIYTQLVDCRVWSLSGMCLRKKDMWAGVLLILNPRRNIGDDTVMRMTGARITTEILSSNHK